MSQPPAFPFLILGTGGRIFDPDIWDGREHLAKFEQDCWALTFFDCESWVIGERSGNGPMVICAESQAEAATIIGPRKVCWIHLQPPASGVDETDPLELFSGAPSAVIDDARAAVLRDHFEEAFRLRNTVEYSSTRFYLLTASALLHLDGIQPNDLAYDLFCFARAGLSRGLTVQHLADHFEMDRSSFTRWFEQLTGISPGQWLRILRLHCAAIRVWQKGEKSIALIISELGFSDPSSFGRSFKSYFHMSPSAFRKIPLEQAKELRRKSPGLTIPHEVLATLTITRLLP